LSDIDNAENVFSDRAILLCAVAETEIIGTGAIRRIDNRECEMTRMFVAPAHRGCGVGRTIADELLKFAIAAEYSQMRLASNKVLTASHRLYERMGFKATSPWEPGGDEHSRYFVLRLDGTS
jgi:GNAT superfamily N-acetyltransferase